MTRFIMLIALIALGTAGLAGCRDAAPVAPLSLDVETEIAAAGGQGKAKGGHIVFVRDGDIYIMNARGGGATQLTTCGCDAAPALSPGGERIAFVRRLNGDDIYVMHADGSGVTRLTQNAGDNDSPTWSPDGTRIAFQTDRDGDLEIYAMNADGTGAARLTTSSGRDMQPAWSPDGTRIAFMSERVSAGNREIYVMDADGTDPVRLTNYSFHDVEPTWSPDGTRIAFTRQVVVSQSPFQSSYEIAVMTADGTSLVVLTSAPTAFDIQPSWSPDGTRIAFASDRDGDYDIYVIRSDGGRVSLLTRNAVSDSSPDWGK